MKNHLEINRKILEKEDFKERAKNEDLYNYLLKNNVAYYHSKCISNRNNAFEEKILKTGSQFNDQFYKSLQCLRNLCRKEDIEFALFKTYKFIPESVDGDIDLIVKKKDFNKLMEILKNEGFNCELEGSFKGVCEKEGFLKLEPRSVVSYHGYKVLDEEEIWKNVTTVETPVGKVNSTSLTLDVLALLLNVLYGPNYIRLYLYLMFCEVKKEELFSICDLGDLRFLIKKLNSRNILSKEFPIFLGFFEYLYWFFRYLLFTNKISFVNKARHFAFFFYSKFKYLFFGKLHFRHKWF